jgi:hypothetical protein
VQKLLPLVLAIVVAASAAAQQKTPAGTASVRPTAAAPATGVRDEDPVVAAVQRSAEMHAQAADAAREAVEKANHGGPLIQAQRHLLMAAALLYNSSAQLERVAKKETMRADAWQATGEQKERAAGEMEEEKDKTQARRQGKAYVAYGTAQATIAESIATFAARQAELAKEAEAAGKATTSEPLEKSAKNIIDANQAAQALAAGVRETRGKLEKLTP